MYCIVSKNLRSASRKLFRGALGAEALGKQKCFREHEIDEKKPVCFALRGGRKVVITSIPLASLIF